MNEFLVILLVLIFAVTAASAVALIKYGYDAFICFKNRRINERIGILYRMGMVESANILHAPFLKYYRR